MSSQSHRVYWERQGADRMCGLHCLNALMQGPVFTSTDLGKVANELDAEERKIMAQGSMGEFSSEYKDFVAEGSANVADDGFFGVTVLDKCLAQKGNFAIPSYRPDVVRAMQDPASQEAFLCNRNEHWFAIRKVGTAWYDLDSLKPAPTAISPSYLKEFLASMLARGYTVFVVQGFLPQPDSSQWRHRDIGKQMFLDTKEIAARHEEAAAKAKKEAKDANKMVNGDGNDEDGAPAGRVVQNPNEVKEHVWPSSGGQRLGGQSSGGAQSATATADDDPELAAALAASMADHQASLPQPPPEPTSGPKVTFCVRLPSGQKIQRAFSPDHTPANVLSWLMTSDTKVEPPLSMRSQWALVSTFPKRRIAREGDGSITFTEGANAAIEGQVATLKECGLGSSEMFNLQV